MNDEVTLKLMELSPDTIKAIIADLVEAGNSKQSYTIQKLMAQLVALVGEDDAKEMVGE